MERAVAAYESTYGWDMSVQSGEFWRVRPARVYGWISDGTGQDGGATFAQSATRGRF